MQPVTPNPQGVNLANQVLPHIGKETTPEQFDAVVANAPGYQLSQVGQYGEHALMQAARVGNHVLTRHIAQQGGKELVNLCGSYKWTPLFNA